MGRIVGAVRGSMVGWALNGVVVDRICAVAVVAAAAAAVTAATTVVAAVAVGSDVGVVNSGRDAPWLIDGVVEDVTTLCLVEDIVVGVAVAADVDAVVRVMLCCGLDGLVAQEWWGEGCCHGRASCPLELCRVR
jgi:hypothetical protein